MSSTLSPDAVASSAPLTPPEPALTPEELVRRADALRPVLRERQAETEASGNVSADTNQLLVDAGFYRAVQPRAFGGYEFDLPTFARVMTSVARGCPETAWVLSIVSGHVYQLATFPLEGQRAAYGRSGDFRAPEVAAPQGKGRRVDGGYLVSGAWDYASGSTFATHVLLTFVLEDPRSGEPATRMGVFGREDFEVVQNWDVIGMQGTGSNRVVLADVFVPEHLTKPYPPIGLEVPSEVYARSTLFHGPARPFIVMESAAVIVGAAEGALDLYEETFHSRKASGPAGGARADLAEYQLNFGRCRALVDTARAALLQTAVDFTAAAQRTQETGEPCPDDDVRRMVLVLLQSIHLAHEAVDIVFRTAGSSASRKDSMIGRYWRNVGVLRGHLAHQSDSAAVNYGRTHFGHPPVGIA
ncbi:acyl-CoA dehydrogenase family protein [Kineococcus rhizosphaerae]|uniref:acyl-CoA dehydrogenase family protein n=1 Tax=Kineococcus rhizosphaerae TaxID=559628 RepID=UPI003CCB96ED